MKKGAFLIIAFLTSSFLLFSQGKGRKQRINREEGGFIKCRSVCNIHDRNCLYSNGYHEVTSYRLDNNEKFCTYKGNFLLRRYHGKGEYHNADGSLDYKGTFTYGFFKKGILTNKYGDTLKGTFKKEDKKWYLNNGYISSSRWYTLSDDPDNMYRSGSGDKMFVRGHIKEGKLHGHVYFKILEGDYKGTEFNGEFVNGKISGCGIMKIYRKDNFLAPDINPYSNDCYISFKSVNPNGDIYAGQWDNCNYNGWGVTISQEYVNSFGYWEDNNKVSTDIPYKIITQSIDEVCGDDFVNWSELTTSDTIFNDDTISYDLNDNGGSINYTMNPKAKKSDNRGNVSTGIKISYKINYIKASVRGDYPPGKYNLYSSKNAVELLKSLDSTLNILSKKVQDSLSYTLIDTNTVVDFKIFASTDRNPIYSGIDYKWAEFGLDSIYNGEVYVLDDLNDYTLKRNVHIKNTIKHNTQLAFLRAIGIKNYLMDSIKINTQKVNYKFNIDTVSQKRTIGVQMFIHNRNTNRNPKIKHTNRVENSPPENSYKLDNSAAIIIYLTDYRDQISNSGLIYAEDDAMLIKKYFSKTMGIPDANIRMLDNENATINDIKILFEKTILKLAKQRISNFFIYYQGHGCINKKKNLYLLPYNFNSDINGHPKLDEIDSLAGYINTAKKIVKDTLNKDVNFFTIFDACASYSEEKYGGRKPANYSNNNNACIISASQMFSTARYDKTLKHSLLTYGFCYSLFDFEKTDDNNDNRLSFKEIYNATKKYVKLQTTQTSKNPQIPAKYGNGNWDFEILNTEDLKK